MSTFRTLLGRELRGRRASALGTPAVVAALAVVIALGIGPSDWSLATSASRFWKCSW